MRKSAPACLRSTGAIVTHWQPVRRESSNYNRAMKRIALALALLVSAATAYAKEVLPFIEDDYAKAVARAKSKNVPIFVEAWAPW
jgi:hypothetical protein